MILASLNVIAALSNTVYNKRKPSTVCKLISTHVATGVTGESGVATGAL